MIVGLLREELFEVGIEIELIACQILVESFGAKNLGDLNELVEIVLALEERLPLEHHA